MPKSSSASWLVEVAIPTADEKVERRCEDEHEVDVMPLGECPLSVRSVQCPLPPD